MTTTDHTYFAVSRLLDTLLSDLKATDAKPVEEQNAEYRARLIASINALAKIKAYY